jgi:hypothetical protein
MTKAISPTTTKHPHLSIVQFFKEPLQKMQLKTRKFIRLCPPHLNVSFEAPVKSCAF